MPIKKRKKLLRPLCNGERVEVSFFCFCLDRGDNLIGQRDLGIKVSTVIAQIIQTALNYFGHILCKHFGRFCSVNRRSLTELVRAGKLAVQSLINDLFIESVFQYRKRTPFFYTEFDY